MKTIQVDSNDKIHHLMLPCQGDKGSNLLKSMKRYVNTKLGLTFPIKDKISFEHQHEHDLMYYANCTEPSCCDN